MLKTTRALRPSRRLKTHFDVEIAGVATAVPRHALSQADATRRARRLFPGLADYEGLFHNTGIETRYTCQPAEWYELEHGWEERTDVFVRHALDLLEEVARGAVREAGIELKDIGAIVVNTITGLAIPSLDAKLINRLDLPASVERLPIFGLGCGGGVGGLARSARYAQAMPGAHVLFLTVDLCSLCLRVNDPSMAMFVSAALFGDGAACVVLRNTKGGRQASGGRGRIIAARDHFWRDTEHIMGWDIRHDGFGVVLSPDLPQLLRRHLEPAVQAFLGASGMSLGEFNGFLFHPGGAKVLKTVQSLLELSRDDLGYSWAVLRDFGNMSSPTALFTLDQALHAGASGPHLMAAFGPGFSAYFLAVEL
ncbi:type III polyketide synthase [Methyloceanibacter sp.]|uniref:type III polyketide synthase n=1 Tax=Methyloceanibacter sp. TaxID=1965321 RepID=UPI003D6CA7F3